jgi:cellulose/xylan binding protein with CBM9 domain
MRRVILTTAACLAAAAAFAAQAPMAWQPGDCGVVARPAGPYTPEQIVKQAGDGGLSWVVVCNPVPTRAAAVPDMGEVLKKLGTQTLTPIHAIRWRAPRPISEDIIGLGAAPDLPMPEPKAQEVIDWVNALGGAAVLASPGRKLGKYAAQLRRFAAFEAFHNGRWNPECNLGGTWDQLLAKGRRVCIVGGSTDVDRPVLGKGAMATYVLAAGRTERDVVEAIRAGRTIVAERDRIRMTFTVDGKPPGAIVVPKGGKVKVRFSIDAAEPVDEIVFIGNVRVFADRPLDKTAALHTVRLNVAKATRSFTLKLSEATTYLRAIAVIYRGACRTMSSPVYIGATAPKPLEPNLAAQSRELVVAALGGVDWRRPAAARDILGKVLADGKIGCTAALYLGETMAPEEVGRIRPLLKSDLPMARALTAFVLMRVQGAKGLGDVRPLLDDVHWSPRIYAAQAFARYAGAEEMKTLARMGQDQWREVRECALLALVRIRSAESVARLRAALSDSIFSVRATAERHLTGMLGVNEKEKAKFFAAFKAGAVDEKLLKVAVPREPVQQLVRAALRVTLEASGPVRPRPGDGTAGGFPVVRVSRVKQAPVIDGRATDAAWVAAKPAVGFALESGRRPRHATTVRALYDATKLYLLIECDEPAAGKMLTSVRRRDGHVWLDDSLDIYLSPFAGRTGMRPLYYRFSVNSGGAKFDEMRRQRRWNAKWPAATSVGKKSWTLEMALPFAAVKSGTPEAGKTRWLVNIVRHRRVKPEEDSYFSRGSTRSLEKYGELVFE